VWRPSLSSSCWRKTTRRKMCWEDQPSWNTEMVDFFEHDEDYILVTELWVLTPPFPSRLNRGAVWLHIREGVLEWEGSFFLYMMQILHHLHQIKIMHLHLKVQINGCYHMMVIEYRLKSSFVQI
jgi:hypothetical protein